MTFIIAEAGINHNGDVETAKALIAAAKDAGADAVKFQMFDAETLEPVGDRRDMLKGLELSYEHHKSLKAIADDLGIQYLCSAFDVDSLAFLRDELKLRQFKIASGNLDNWPLLEAAAAAGTLILSTGGASIEDIAETVGRLNQARTHGLILLHCISAYPAPSQDCNLKAIAWMRDYLGSKPGTAGASVGFSDHSLGIAIPIAAVAMGAVMLEKHLTLDRTAKGPDHHCSLEAAEFAAMVAGIRDVEKAIGDGRKRVMPSEVAARQVFAERAARREQVAVAQAQIAQVTAETVAATAEMAAMPNTATEVATDRTG